MVPVVLISLSVISNPVIISALIVSNSSSVMDDVTIDVIPKVATIPVLDGTALGTLVVGARTGFNVGLAVTNKAQQKVGLFNHF